MPPLETVPFSEPVIQFRRFGYNLFCQIVGNQLVRTEIKYPRSICYKQFLCAFILSLIIEKSKTMQTSVVWVQNDSHCRRFVNWSFRIQLVFHTLVHVDGDVGIKVAPF